MIKNIIFDFGNVLFDLDLPAMERNMRLLMGNQFDAAVTRLRKAGIFELYETGGLTTEEFVDIIRNSVQPALSGDWVISAWNSIFIGMPRHRFELLLDLRRHYKVFLLSNINALHEYWIAEYMIREHNIHDYESRYFDGVYFSHFIRLRKPERAIYEYVLSDAEILPEETLFFDDLELNVSAANALGIRGQVHGAGLEIADHVASLLKPREPGIPRVEKIETRP